MLEIIAVITSAQAQCRVHRNNDHTYMEGPSLLGALLHVQQAPADPTCEAARHAAPSHERLAAPGKWLYDGHRVSPVDVHITN